MSYSGRQATIVGIIANIILFALKFFAGILTGSLSIISDALNSLSDTVYSIAVFLAVRIASKKADSDHPFGHNRAEPIAALVVAILAGILGFEIIKEGVISFISHTPPAFSFIAVIVILFSIALKVVMFLYLRFVAKRIKSPAIYASAIDSRNDILISFSALFGFLGPQFGLDGLDPIVGMAIGAFIVYSGYGIGRDNIDYLMGKSPDPGIIDRIRREAISVNGVKGVHDIRAHYVGNYIHVQVHVEIDKDMETKKSHDIGKIVQRKVESIEFIDHAFIHIDPR